MKLTIIAAVMISLGTQTLAQSDDAGPCVDQFEDQQSQDKSPDPALNVDGYGQLVGEQGETNADNTETDEGDAYSGDPTYGDCDGR